MFHMSKFLGIELYDNQLFCYFVVACHGIITADSLNDDVRHDIVINFVLT